MKMKPLQLTSIRITASSPDSPEVTVTMKPKYTDARSYLMSRESLQDLIDDLQLLASKEAAKPSGLQNQLAVKTPQKWMVGSGLPKHPVVLLIFDVQTDTQGGYALSADAATDMAAGLLKNAEALRKHISGKGNGSS
jgi:hypothetical protein